MLMTILALTGLFFIIALVYNKGRKNGIKEAIAYFVKERNKRKVYGEVIEDYEQALKMTGKSLFDKAIKLTRRIKNEPDKG